MKRPGANEPELKGGPAAERLKEFLRQRLPLGVSPEEIQVETDHWNEQEAKGSQHQTEKHNSPLPQGPDPGNDKPE